MTPFNDADLKSLKDSLAETDYPYPLKALLARLEAAEACIDDHRRDCLADIGQRCTCGYSEKLEAWLKSAGKE